jgi:hypothetical protein
MEFTPVCQEPTIPQSETTLRGIEDGYPRFVKVIVDGGESLQRAR